MPHPVSGYKLKDGKKVPGVTTVCGRFKDSSNLIFWAWGRGRDFPSEPLYTPRDKAAELGTILHETVEEFIRQLPADYYPLVDLPEEESKQVYSAYDAFREWFDSNKFEVIAQEEQLVSETHRFGGCPDAIARDGKGRLCLLDWKTSNGLWPEMILQLGAYRILWNENHPDMQLTGGSHLCRFAKEKGDFAHHFFPNIDEAERGFLLMRELYGIDRELKKRC